MFIFFFLNVHVSGRDVRVYKTSSLVKWFVLIGRRGSHQWRKNAILVNLAGWNLIPFLAYSLHTIKSAIWLCPHFLMNALGFVKDSSGSAARVSLLSGIFKLARWEQTKLPSATLALGSPLADTLELFIRNKQTNKHGWPDNQLSLGHVISVELILQLDVGWKATGSDELQSISDWTAVAEGADVKIGD